MTVGDEVGWLLNRVQVLEDERDIARLVASYGPLADSADPDGTSNLWTEHGVYDIDGWKLKGHSAIAEMINSEAHQALVAHGCSHFLGPCVVTVSGDTAVALCESLVLRRRVDDYVVFRASANHFDLRRTTDGWRILTRTTRTLSGTHEARRILASGVAGAAISG